MLLDGELLVLNVLLDGDDEVDWLILLGVFELNEELIVLCVELLNVLCVLGVDWVLVDVLRVDAVEGVLCVDDENVD